MKQKPDKLEWAVLECLRGGLITDANEIANEVFHSGEPTDAERARLSRVLRRLTARGQIEMTCEYFLPEEAFSQKDQDERVIEDAVYTLSQLYPGVLPEKALAQFLTEKRRRTN